MIESLEQLVEMTDSLNIPESDILIMIQKRMTPEESKWLRNATIDELMELRALMKKHNTSWDIARLILLDKKN